MKLENYFDFVQEDVIRIKGNRIGIEIVLEDYLEGASPEEILLRYPTLSLEKIHATILYYLAKKGAVEAYLERVRQLDEKASQEQLQNPSPYVVELRERFAKVSQELLEAKKTSTKPVNVL
jgi:uncharacterized protein (DUF433 family)